MMSDFGIWEPVKQLRLRAAARRIRRDNYGRSIVVETLAANESKGRNSRNG